MGSLGSRLRALRLAEGMTLRELARRADVSASFVSQIENEKAQPSVATLYAFSRVLDVTVDELFDGSDRATRIPEASLVALAGAAEQVTGRPFVSWQPSPYSHRVSIIHPSHRSRLSMAEGVTWERLAATPETSVGFIEITYASGARSTEDGGMIVHTGYEYGYVLEGELEVSIGDEVFVLRPGESLGFDSTIPHALRNVGPGDFRGLWFMHGGGH